MGGSKTSSDTQGNVRGEMPAVDSEKLADELRNFEEIVRTILPSPGEVPHLPGVDIAGSSLPLSGTTGGDHIIYVDFNRRFDLDARIRKAQAAGSRDVVRALEENRRRSGILLADVSGHRATDALVAAMLHQAFLLGSYYELEISGEITTRLLEYIKKRFYETTNIKKFFTLLYGEISREGRFRFVSAASPPPLIFSREHQRMYSLDSRLAISQAPVGFFPSEDDPDKARLSNEEDAASRFSINEIQLLSEGDALLIYTDGLADHDEGRFFTHELEPILIAALAEPAAEIAERVAAAVRSAGEQQDDITFVIIKRTSD
ncbi:MAG: serine/threonine-protein phosphatase [Acidobacteriota bacterium]|nr:MAG: serine/threonine-protein phosphatase [Acidobacteriota bacterium]